MVSIIGCTAKISIPLKIINIKSDNLGGITRCQLTVRSMNEITVVTDYMPEYCAYKVGDELK